MAACNLNLYGHGLMDLWKMGMTSESQSLNIITYEFDGYLN